jgi:hypothetical protein
LTRRLFWKSLLEQEVALMGNPSLTIKGFAVAALMASLGCKGNQVVGQPCDLGVTTKESQAVVNIAASDCATGICLKPVKDQGATPTYPATGATCTSECSSDADCEGENRDPGNSQDTRCNGHFVCAVPFTVGPLCCRRYCLCSDFLSPAGAPLPIACQGPNALTCQAAAGSASGAGVGQQTDIYISIAPARQLDLLFMIDNSAGMGPKALKMTSQLPKLLTALKDPTSGTYPDLRVAIIDSDLGTGGQYSSGSCGPNDGNGKSPYGDAGNFQMRGAAACGVKDGSLWLEYTNGKAVNYDVSKDIGTVFGCLAGNLGSLGCGEEHQLQAFEFAFASGTIPGRDSRQESFLRPNAYLGLVFLTDEDDCSAATNFGMFGDGNHPELKGESASLRCATRAHQCSGRNLTQSPPGYPTEAPFSASFASCSARTDACPNAINPGGQATDTSQPTACSPLRDFRLLAQEMKDLKRDMASEKLLVAGIFGWPLMLRNADGSPVLDSKGKPQVDMANATYKIDAVPNPNTFDTSYPKSYNYWPLCYDPDHPAPGDGSFSADAWDWGATGGLRLSAFIDEFGENGLKYSICERDFAPAMKGIGDALAKRLQNLCVDAKLMDVDLVTPGLQPDCRVAYRTPQTSPDGSITYVESPESLPMCAAGATPETVASDCWQIAHDLAKCPASGQLITMVRTAAEIANGPLAPGTKISMQCWTCPDLVSVAGCDY